jgi:hypothetical protein
MDLEGGLLYKCILGEAKYFKDNYLLLNAAQQNPIYFRNGKITNL